MNQWKEEKQLKALLPREDFNGLDHPRQLQTKNQSKVAVGRIKEALYEDWRIHVTDH
jgi:hypothetical protein